MLCGYRMPWERRWLLGRQKTTDNSLTHLDLLKAGLTNLFGLDFEFLTNLVSLTIYNLTNIIESLILTSNNESGFEFLTNLVSLTIYNLTNIIESHFLTSNNDSR